MTVIFGVPVGAARHPVRRAGAVQRPGAALVAGDDEVDDRVDAPSPARASRSGARGSACSRMLFGVSDMVAASSGRALTHESTAARGGPYRWATRRVKAPRPAPRQRTAASRSASSNGLASHPSAPISFAFAETFRSALRTMNRRPGSRGKAPGELPAVHHRHHQVQENQVRHLLLEPLQRLAPVPRPLHLVPLDLEDLAEGIEDVRIVIDDQHPTRQALLPVSEKSAHRSIPLPASQRLCTEESGTSQKVHARYDVALARGRQRWA